MDIKEWHIEREDRGRRSFFSVLKMLIRKELTQFFRNKFLPVLLVFMPIMLVLVMPLVSQMDIQSIKVAFIDHDRSTLSMRMESHIANSDYFHIQNGFRDYEEAIEQLDKGKVDVIITVPEHFERDMQDGQAKSILIVANAVNATKGGQGMQYAVQTIASAVTEITREQGLPVGETSPFTIQNRYNPTSNYRIFMLPALIIILLLLNSCFLPLLNIMTEKEQGTIEQINVTPVTRLEFILAKLIPYWVMALLLVAFSILLAWVFYGLFPAGSVAVIFLAALLFSLCMSGLAVALANLSDTMQQAIFVIFFFAMIFILMSGLLTPIQSMPFWVQCITYTFPTRYVIDVFRSVYLKGTLLSELRFDLLMLTALAVIFNVLATVTYKKQQ